MSEATAVSLEALAERVQKLEVYIAEQVTPRFDDLQNDHRSLSERINEYQGRVEKQLSWANQTLVDSLYKLIHETKANLSVEFREEFDKLLTAFRERIQQEISSTNSKVLAVRSATREEIKSGAAIAVRQATPAELRK